MAGLLLAIIYLCFVSLGLPDSLLGSAWPVMHAEINVPVSFAGIISIVIFLGTILSSLYSGKLLCKFGAGKVTAVSAALTAVGLFGFSVSFSFWHLILFSIPYGLGAGGVDAILNNYVALHYKAQHMSWLHCMWGLGASVSPYIMSYSLINFRWNHGYLAVSVVQIVLTVIIFISLPIWDKGVENGTAGQQQTKLLTFREIFAIKGAIPCFITFFCYCSFELTTTLWSSSYFVSKWGVSPEDAAGYASMFYIGITLGRLVSGFLAMKMSDRFLISTGMAIVTVGIAFLFVPHFSVFALLGFIIIGLGCAPIYPCFIHMTPDVFGKEKSQAMIGVQMAFAYTGFLVMPSLFGVITEYISISLLPVYQFVLLAVMFVMHELLVRKSK